MCRCFTAKEGDRFGEMSGSSEACSYSRSSSCATRLFKLLLLGVTVPR